MLASQRGLPEVVHLLLKSGTEVNAKTLNGKTALSIAAGANHADVLKLLTSYGGKYSE